MMYEDKVFDIFRERQRNRVRDGEKERWSKRDKDTPRETERREME